PVIIIKYKVLYKWRCGKIITGLASEIRLYRDVINQEDEGYEIAARRLPQYDRGVYEDFIFLSYGG
ncbi:uncharacterized protein FOBCDRAFT_150305, partial [Fusarium oxysporum Fo47]|uniref:uncharacterized protein n=1 Tax=Fusarium oxysporum Fo47 TaxID=660027 RepID=UPI002869DEEC